MEKRLLDLKHDIRNPLYITKSLIESHLEYLDMPSEGCCCETSSRTELVLNKVLREVDRVLRTIRKLNQIAQSKFSSHLSQESARRTICVKEILHRILLALKEGRYLEHLVLIEFVPSDLPPIVGNFIDLEEIFFNLIINAVQAMKSSGQLMIKAHCVAKPSPQVVMTFQDTGQGISEHALPYIFDPFYTGRVEEGGVGFGLYIVKQLVERNGGRITVESQMNKGTMFRLTFPIEPKE